MHVIKRAGVLQSSVSEKIAQDVLIFSEDTPSSPGMVKKAIKIVLRDGGSGGRSRTSSSRKRKRSAAATTTNSAGNAAHVPALLRTVPQPAAVAAAGADADNGNDFNLDLDADDVPCDTLLALRSLISKGVAALCPLATNAASSGSLPFVLKPMLHDALLSSTSSTSNAGASNDNGDIEETNKILSAGAATGVTVELDELRRTNAVRLLQLHGTGDAARDVAVMDTQTFECGLRDAFVAAAATGSTNLYQHSTDLCKWFVSNLAVWNQPFVQHEAIRSSLLEHNDLPTLCRDVSLVVDHLVGTGLLLPRNNASSSSSDRTYWFTLPGLGPAARAIADGRRRILSKVQRSNYGEIKRSVLEVGAVPSSKRVGAGQSLVRQSGTDVVEMPAAFCIRDLLSRGQITLRGTPAGQFVRVSGCGKMPK